MSAPAGDVLFDTHTHVFTSDVARYPVDICGAREGEEAIRRRINEDPLTPEKLLSQWDESGVVAGAAVQYNTIYKTDNRFLLDASERYRSRLSAVVILDAAAPQTPATLETLITTHGIAGLRLFGYPDAGGSYPWLDCAAALDTWSVAAAHSLPVIVMYAPAGPTAAAFDRIATLARRFPDLPVVLDHFGWPGHDDQCAGPHPSLAVFRDIPNVHFKLTTINMRMFAASGVDAAQFVHAAAGLFGAGRMMWGSDAGNTLERYADMAAKARAAALLLDFDDRRQFLFATGSRLFGRTR